MAGHGKKYVEAVKKVDATKTYTPQEAVKLVKETGFTKFDATAELHLKLGVDVKQADQMVRGVVLLPHGTGKKVRILVFADGEGERIGKDRRRLAEGNAVLLQVRGSLPLIPGEVHRGKCITLEETAQPGWGSKHSLPRARPL